MCHLSGCVSDAKAFDENVEIYLVSRYMTLNWTFYFKCDSMISFHLISKSFQKPHFNFENNLILFNVGIKHMFPLEAMLSLVSSV